MQLARFEGWEGDGALMHPVMLSHDTSIVGGTLLPVVKQRVVYKG